MATWEAAGPTTFPKSLDQPILEVNFNARHATIEGQPLLLNVELALRADCCLLAKPVFIAEIVQAGIFRLTDAAMANDAEVLAYCSSQLYPAARQTLAWLTMGGGFQPLLINDPRLEQALRQSNFGQTTARAVPLPGWPSAKLAGAPPAPPAVARKLGVPAAVGMIGGLLLGAAVTSWWLTQPMEAATTIAAGNSTLHPTIQVPAPVGTSTEPPAAAAADMAVVAAASVPALVAEPEPSNRQIESLLQEGKEWLSAQTPTHWTLLVSESEKAEPLLELGSLTFEQPLRLTRTQEGRFAAITGAYASDKEARIALSRLVVNRLTSSPRIAKLEYFGN